MFPIRSVRGEVIGFGGRVLDRGEPKYLNSPETPVFVKGRELYGLFEARTALRERGYALVVEGYMDVVALAQLGFRERGGHARHGVHRRARAQALPLHRLGGVQLRRRRRRPPRRRARARGRPAPRHRRAHVRFLFLPPEHDPDSLRPRARRRGLRGAGCASGAAVAPVGRARRARACDLGTAEGRAACWPRPAAVGSPARAWRSSGRCWASWPRAPTWRRDELAALWGEPAPPAGHAASRRPGQRPPPRPARAWPRRPAVARHGQPPRPRALAAAAAQRPVGDAGRRPRPAGGQTAPYEPSSAAWSALHEHGRSRAAGPRAVGAPGRHGRSRDGGAPLAASRSTWVEQRARAPAGLARWRPVEALSCCSSRASCRRTRSAAARNLARTSQGVVGPARPLQVKRSVMRTPPLILTDWQISPII